MYRKKVLIFADHYLPGFKAGGPIRSIQSLCDGLKNSFDIYLVTRNHDHGSVDTYANIIFEEWTSVNGIKVMYCDSRRFNMVKIYNIMCNVRPDIIQLNSLMSLKFTFFPLLISFFSNFKKCMTWIKENVKDEV